MIERGMDVLERERRSRGSASTPSDTAELFFDDVREPRGEPARRAGIRVLQLVNRWWPSGSSWPSGQPTGCEVAFAITLAYIKERKAFGKPVESFSRFVMAVLKTKIDVTRCFVDRRSER